MKQNEKWLQWAVELQSLAQAGLYYTENPFDQERYQRIRDISAEILALQTEIPLEKAKDLFCCEIGYQTPKLDTRAAISVGENAVKEVREEAGLEVIPERIIAVQDREKHNQPPYAYKVCKVFVLCRLVGGHFQENIETTESRYFGLDELPPLATEKNTEEQIRMCFEACQAEHWTTLFD